MHSIYLLLLERSSLLHFIYQKNQANYMETLNSPCWGKMLETFMKKMAIMPVKVLWGFFWLNQHPSWVLFEGMCEIYLKLMSFSAFILECAKIISIFFFILHFHKFLLRNDCLPCFLAYNLIRWVYSTKIWSQTSS